MADKDATPRGLGLRLAIAQVASCSCYTKTPAIQYHDEMCRYRLFNEAETELTAKSTSIAELERQLAAANDKIAALTTLANERLADYVKMRAERDRLREDAERYLWAKPILDGSDDEVANQRALALAAQLGKGLIGDAAIDTARKGKS